MLWNLEHSLWQRRKKNRHISLIGGIDRNYIKFDKLVIVLCKWKSWEMNKFEVYNIKGGVKGQLTTEISGIYEIVLTCKIVPADF